MNRKNIEDELINIITNNIKNNLTNHSIISNIYQKFLEDSKNTIESLKQINDILTNTFQTIASLYNITYDVSTYDKETMKKNIDIFKEKIESLIDIKKPKNIYLCYSYPDEYGHSYCNVVTDKNINHIENTLNVNTLEYILYDDKKILAESMCDLFKIDLEYISNLNDNELYTKIIEFFKIIINDDKVSLYKFSEYLYCIICDHRHSGMAKKWVTI